MQTLDFRHVQTEDVVNRQLRLHDLRPRPFEGPNNIYRALLHQLRRENIEWDTLTTKQLISELRDILNAIAAASAPTNMLISNVCLTPELAYRLEDDFNWSKNERLVHLLNDNVKNVHMSGMFDYRLACYYFAMLTRRDVAVWSGGNNNIALIGDNRMRRPEDAWFHLSANKVEGEFQKEYHYVSVIHQVKAVTNTEESAVVIDSDSD